jgi:archaellum biogenesis ATPase FlaH
MKIKSKLLLLISSLMGAVVISIAVFVLLQFNITQMEKEKEYLDVLGKALHKELSEVSTFFFPDTPFQSQIENYNQARLIKQGSLSNLTKIKALRKISVTINDSLQSIEKLEELQSSTIDRFNSSAEKLIENVVIFTLTMWNLNRLWTVNSIRHLFFTLNKFKIIQ